mgnify:CR=1 FL=1
MRLYCSKTIKLFVGEFITTHQDCLKLLLEEGMFIFCFCNADYNCNVTKIAHAFCVLLPTWIFDVPV